MGIRDRDYKLPDCLNDKIVTEIWQEVLTSKFDQTVIKAIVEGQVTPTRELILEFVQAAMEYPHFATAQDVCSALNVCITTAHRLVKDVKRRAREQRP